MSSGKVVSVLIDLASRSGTTRRSSRPWTVRSTHASSRCSTTFRWAAWATTVEIAVAALYLADPENTYMNGHVLVVDGGWVAGYHREL